MKTKLSLILALILTPLLVFGQAGVGTGGRPYVDYSNTDVDFGSFQIKAGALTGQAGSVLSHVTVSVTAAELIAMYTTPKLIVAAPSSGHEIVVAKASFKITRTSTAFTGGGAVILQYDSTANGAGTNALASTIASTVVTGSAGTTHTWRNSLADFSDNTAVDAKGLYLSNATAVFAAGTGTAVVDVWYYLN